ncbi:ribosomal protein L23, putative [Perkinsus marinus ATCC 50983]|uniref:Large ribosomal subunit protein uL23m n=1 Tax=Perkinsus marinus (strain ATCC 50983 / TXsc) TaxID=423536 RepID=C5KBC3_PERM5|nr:ribosomal protein L23, putative [Perkinsus marinus ATCC 50983]EER18449.1 ribosomal protein L23, putative [Perkinsus marinus ATCC 50983]|eukprot:XP_002786653.1 ribosomal protein L23, putative [Perkinsus marinus ATCC 50983]
MFYITRQLLGPPKAPRNVFFPWFNFVIHRSGMYLEPNRIAFRVPVHLTKLEIREYLRKIYGVKAIRCTTVVRFPKVMKNRARAYYKNGAQFKKAIVTCEETIPNTVKMLSSSSTPHLNPAIHRNKLSMQYDYIPFGQDRKNDWKPRHRHAWREPIPLLLRGDHGHPTITKREEMALHMDTTLPHQDITNTKKAMLDDLAEIRRRKYAYQHQYDHLKGSEDVHIEEPAGGGPDQEPLFRL